MKIWKQILSIILICALICPTITMNADASDTKTDNYWFTDDFSHAKEDLSLMGWTNPDNILLDEANGKLEVGKAGGESTSPYTYLRDASGVSSAWSNYVLQADVTITDNQLTEDSAGRVAGLVVAAPANASGAKGYEFILCNQINKDTGKVAKMYCALKDRTGNKKNSEDVTCDIEIGREYTLRMAVTDNQILCYIDNELMITYDYQGTEENPFVGTIGLHAAKNVAEFDNIRVWSNNEQWVDDNFSTTDLTINGWTNSEDMISVDAESQKLNVGYSECGSDIVYTYLAGHPIAEGVENFAVEADVKITNSSLKNSNSKPLAALIVGADTTNTGQEDGYQFLIRNSGDVRLVDKDKTADNGYAISDRKESCTIEVGKTYNMKIVVQGDKIKCYLNNELKIEDEYKGTAEHPFAGLIGFRAQVNVLEVDNVSIRPADNSYDLSFYRKNRGTESAPYIHPHKEGHVFGGWYTDSAFETPLGENVTTGSAYAKWVDEKVLNAAVQAPLSLVNADLEMGTTTTIRFLSTVDCYDYQKVGFYITGEGGSTTVHESTTVYSSIRATIEGTEVTYQPNDERYFSKDSVSFITYSLTNIPVNSNTVNKLITVTPYWITADGTLTTGVTRDANNKPISLAAVIKHLKESTALFYDDFSAEKLDSRWTLYSIGNQTSEAILENEQLHLTHPEGYVTGTNIYYMSYVSGGENWSDYVVSADVLMEDVANSKDQVIAITARQSGQTRYEFRMTYDGSDITGYLCRYKGSSSTVIGAYEPGLMNEVLEAGKIIGLNTSYNLKMSLKGNCIRIYLDGQLIDTFYDESEDALTTGTAGIYLANSSVYIDNFKVEADYKSNIASITIADCENDTIALYQGHDINVWEEELEIIYEDTTKSRIQLLPEMIADFENTVLGTQEVALTYRGVTNTIKVTISDRPEYLELFEETVNAFADTVTESNLEAFYQLQNIYDELSNYEIAQLDTTVVEKYMNLYQTMELLLYPQLDGIALLYDGSLDKQSAMEWDDGREQYVGKWKPLNDLFYYIQRPYRTMGTGYHSPNIYGEINMVSADIMLLNEHMYGGVLLNWSENGYYRLRVNGNHVGEDGNPNYLLQLSIYDGNGLTNLKSCYLSENGIDIQQKEWFNLCLTYEGGQLKGYVNGTLLLSYDDSERTGMTKGECAARISNGDALVDNFRVYGTEIERTKSEVTIDPTYYSDDFEDETVGMSPSHWVENTEWNNLLDNWTVQLKDSNKVYGTDVQEDYSSTYLHVFEKNPNYTVRFMTDKISDNGTFGFLTRMSPETAYVKIGYDASNSKWYICSQRAESEGETIVYSDTYSITKGTWYTARVVEQGAMVSLYIDDTLVLKTESAVEVSPGRLGFYVDGASMYVDDVNCIFENGDVPQDGVVSYDIKPENAYNYMEVEAIDDSTLMGFVSNRKFLSTDAGLTWSDVTNATEWQGVVSDGFYKSIVKLHDGSWLQIRTQASSKGTMDEDDMSVWTSTDFKTWERIGRVIEEADISYGPTGESNPFIHVSTATEIQLEDGNWRIFCPMSIRRYDGTSNGIYTVVYYSDDGGATWKKSANDTRAVQPGAEDDVLTQWSESKIIKGSDGVLRMYCSRNEYGCIVYTESDDGGVTWENMVPVPELQCAMSSFGVYEDPTEPGTFYMAWVNSTEGYYTTSMWPRTRVCLARSYDGKTWEFLTNIEWMGDTNSPFNGVPLYQCLDPSVFVTEDYVYIMHGRSSRENSLYTYSAHQLQNVHYTRIEKSKLKARAWDATTLCDVDFPVEIVYEVEPKKTYSFLSLFKLDDDITIKITGLSGVQYTEKFKENCIVWDKPYLITGTHTIWVTYKNGFNLSYEIKVK